MFLTLTFIILFVWYISITVITLFVWYVLALSTIQNLGGVLGLIF